MKSIQLSAALLSIITCTASLSPAFAANVKKETRITTTESRTYSTKTSNNERVIQNQVYQRRQQVIPASTAIAIAFPQELILRADNETATTLFTAQPIYDQDGNEVVAARSLISARLKPSKGGVEIVADSLIVRGRTVAIRASSIVVPGQTVTVASGADRARESSQLYSKLGGSIGGALNSDDASGAKTGALIGNGLGLIVGFFSPHKETIVKIPQGSIYVLSLQSSVSLP
jgi:hypothetical protein